MALTTFAGKIPIFDGSNFSTWKTQMEALLHKSRLLQIVKGEVTVPAEPNLSEQWTEKDQDARADILIALSPKILMLVRNFKTSKQIWDFLSETYERRSNRQKAELYRKLLNHKMAAGQSISKYIEEFDECYMQLEEMNGKIEEELQVIILLDGLSSEHKEVKAAFNTVNEFPTMKTLRSRLLELQENTDVAPSEAFKAKYGKKYNNANKPGMSKSITCYRCGKQGHMAKNCKTNINKDRSNVVSSNGFVATHEVVQNVNHKSVWYLDSGATSHMTYERNNFEHVDTNYTGTVKLADEKEIIVKGLGTVVMNIIVQGKSKQIKLFKTLWVPDLKNNLMSTSKATDNGCIIQMEGEMAKIVKNNEVLVEARKISGLYTVIVDEIQTCCNVNTKSQDVLELWHKRYGHLNTKSLGKLGLHNMVTGLPDINIHEIECKTCIRGKQVRDKFAKKNEKSSSQVLELIHSDICGPMRTESLSRKLYFATFVDDFSRCVNVKFLRHKSEYIEAFKEFKNAAELQTGNRIKILRTDNAKEMISSEVVNFLKTSGIKHQLSVEYTPQQNGVAERMNRTLVEMARCLMLESNISEMLWAELINTAAYIRNRCPTSLNKNTTPIEIWTGRKPNVKHLRQIGSRSYVLNKKPGKNKWEPRSEEYILVGYCDESKAYRLWKTGDRKITKSRDVKVLEEKFSKIDDASLNFKENEEFVEFRLNFGQNSHNKAIDSVLEETFEDSVERHSDSIEEQNSDEQENIQTDEQFNTLNSIKSRLRSWKLIGQESTQISFEQNPKTLYDVEKSNNKNDWLSAMKSEYDSLIQNKTWNLSDLPPGRKTVGCKWIFTTKYNSDGSIDRRKARLVAKGYSQQLGVDYMDTYAPVVRQGSLRLIYALAVENDLKLRQLDVSTAFLNGDIDEEIYMDQPDGFINEKSHDKVCKLNKAIYGLKQAGRQWFKRIHNVFLKYGLNQSKYDQCVYYKYENSKILIVALYVDDIVIAYNDNDIFKTLFRALQTNFVIKDLQKPKSCVGLYIKYGDGQIFISQPGYISNIVKKYNLENCKATKIPMQIKITLEKEPKIPGEAEKIDEVKYQELIGSLLHISLYSRPDIACCVNMLSQFSKDPRKQHWNCAMQIVKYLNTTKNTVLSYKKTGLPLIGFVDANWAQDVNDRKSQSGFCFILAGSAISWESKKQKVIATSSAEAEYVALSEAAKEAIYLRNILNELGFKTPNPTDVYCDSQSAQHMAKFGSHHSRTKHIDYKYHFIRDAVENKIVDIKYISTNEMPADYLTKPVPKIKHYLCSKATGLQFETNTI